ncbi:MAG: aromatic ring-hydroxylating dioxygenase subunit alpha [Myxococcota bacterium]
MSPTVTACEATTSALAPRTQFPAGWYPLVHQSEIPERGPLGVQRLGRALVVWKTARGVHAADDRCPHRGARLSLGRIDADELRCPYHGFTFGADGRCRRMPDVGKPAPGLGCRMHEVRSAHGYVWIWAGDGPAVGEPAWYPWLPAGGRRTLVTEQWRVPLDLAVENAMDHLHLSVVHPDTVGRGVSIDARVSVTVDDDRVHAAFDDDGFAEFRWPGLWGTRVSEKLGITIAFAPVSERETLLYLEGHRSFATRALLGPLVDLGIRRFHRKALSQDRPIVTSQRGVDPEVDRLFGSDQAIRWYRTKLREHGYTRPQ